jgi:hypothetical protein
VSAVYTQRRNSTQPEGRGVAFPESRLSVGSTRYRHPRRTRTVLQLDVVLDQCLEQRLHVRLIRKRLELSWLAFDREHCAMASAFFTRCRSRPLNSAMPSPLARRSNACARPPAMKHSHIFAPMRRRFHLYCTRAAVVVEGATVRSLSHGEHRHDHRRIRSQPFRRRLPLLLLFTLAVYATPFFAGVTAALAAFNHGAGVIGALVVGLIASVITLVASQAAFAVVKSPAVRGAIALLIAAPAAVAGFTRHSDSHRLASPPKFGATFPRSLAALSSASRLSFVWRALPALPRMSGASFSSLPSHRRPRWRPRRQGIDVGHLHLLVG